MITAGTLVAVIAVYVSFQVLKWFRLRRVMPPGPLGLPWIGNRGQVPSFKPWVKFAEWNKEYGPVSSIMLGSTPTIILGKAQHAWDLLEKRSEIHSSRPRFVMASEILSENRRGLMLPNSTDLWKQWRKMLHNGFHVRKAPAYHSIQSLESKVLLKQIMDNPKNFDGYIKRYAASVVASVTYGRRVDSVEEWVVKENMASMDCEFNKVVFPTWHNINWDIHSGTRDVIISVNLPGKFLVESWPWLLNLPRSLQWFRKDPEQRKKEDEHFLLYLLNDVRTRSKDGTCKDCLTSQALVNRDEGKVVMTDLELAYSVSSPFGAGIETTAGTLSVFILAMLTFPEVLKKAREEVDRVIGNERMPDFHDKDQLPYVVALINETLRWRPIPVLGGTAHASTADDEYQGKFIPKGSSIYANMYGIMRDEELFPSPDDFLPERFLPESKTTHPRINLKEFDLPFGFGRRICPGMHLALNSLFINVSRLIWAFDIQPVTDEYGKDIIPDSSAFTNRFNSRPMPFDCQFIIRNDKVRGMIEAEWENVKSQLDSWN